MGKERDEQERGKLKEKKKRTKVRREIVPPKIWRRKI